MARVSCINAKEKFASWEDALSAFLQEKAGPTPTFVFYCKSGYIGQPFVT
ncbi:hypothetical protein SAMN00808754_2710 [Thermanaeromonas toyohensis ToBE]|uniref:Uncharacterized protein n=1 Tax=Thermanaeromonas toyohensis ToBE TaxID=698762 RepID=A0A1W1W0L2_9FIRM|nr:hypothetical protein SAMN00808754_2710 [Thermanaeromonas toyohensis ToBE]